MEVRTTCPLSSSRIVHISLSKSKTPKTRITTDTIKIHEFFSTSIEANEKDNIIFSFTTKRYDEHRHTSVGVIVVVVILIGTISSAFCLKVFGRIQSPVHCVICVWGKCCAMNIKDICIFLCVCMWQWYWYTHICNLLFSYFLAFLMLWEFQDLKRHKQHKLGESSTNTNTQHKHARVLVNMHAYQDDFWPSVWPSYISTYTDRQTKYCVCTHIYVWENFSITLRRCTRTKTGPKRTQQNKHQLVL